MASMIVRREGTFRRPNSRLSFTFKPSREPQSWPEDVVEYAVSKGFAERAQSRSRKIESATVGGSNS
jgi:hypothetical protein